MLCLKKLKIILQYKYFYLILVIITFIFFLFFTKIIKYKSIYNGNETEFYVDVKDIDLKDNYILLTVKSKEKMLARIYYNKKNQMSNISLGDKLYINGNLILPNNNTNPNQFNYKKYLYNKKIYYILNVKKYKIIKKNRNIILGIKNNLLNNLNTNNREQTYMRLFLLGKNNIDSKVKNNYRLMGVSHLFAISGMHLYLFIGIFSKLLKKFKLNNFSSFIIILSFLIFYLFIIGFSPSLLRSGVLYSIFKVNKLFNFNISKLKCLILTICFLIFLNPFICYNVGFTFSSIISFYLIKYNNLYKNKKNYFIKLLIISLIAFISSFPIVIYNYYEINVLSPLYNLIMVPFVSFIFFPLSILSWIFKNIYFLRFFINILESAIKISNIIPSVIFFSKPSIIVVIFYYCLITLFLTFYKQIIYLVFMIVFLIVHYNYNLLFHKEYLLTIDVGQGDAFLMNLNQRIILIDTGGNINVKGNAIEQHTVSNIIKSMGIKKINYFVITHGDYDHMGESINLANNFKVEKVIFNCGPYNDLEQELIKVLDKKRIPYYSCIKELNIDKNKLYFLQTKEYDNENDNSNVIYTELNGYKFMFMGDASVTTEKEIMNKYNLPGIDVLKVGHHGSKTSSSKEFINEINPKYSIISVGKKNRYGHPNKEVLDNLKDSKLYRTDIDGSIMFKIKNNKLKIETCSP